MVWPPPTASLGITEPFAEPDLLTGCTENSLFYPGKFSAEPEVSLVSWSAWWLPELELGENGVSLWEWMWEREEVSVEGAQTDDSVHLDGITFLWTGSLRWMCVVLRLSHFKPRMIKSFTVRSQTWLLSGIVPWYLYLFCYVNIWPLGKIQSNTVSNPKEICRFWIGFW